MKKLATPLVCSLILVSARASAAGVYFEGGVHLGGDTLLEVGLTDGSTEKIKAGGLISLAVGWHMAVTETMNARLSLGYKEDSITADNGEITFSRTPLDFLLFTQNGAWMLGGGLTYHMSPKFSADAAVIGLLGTVKMDDSLGFVLAADYNTKGIFDREWYLGGRLTIIDYEVGGESISGNSIGVVVGYLF